MKPRVLFLGPLPPPYMGPTLATEVILGSALADEYELLHLDTSDPRDIDTLGAIDFWNIYLALKFYLIMIGKLVMHRPQLVYIPISQTTLGYLKDSGFILIAKLFGRRVLCHLRGGNFKNWITSARPMTRQYVRLVHSMVDGQIVLGECLKSLFTDYLPEDRIYVVPNGKDIDYGPRPAADGKIRCLFLANIIRTKGVLDVLEAVRPVTEECPNVEFVFAGAWEEPDLRTEIEAFLAANDDLPISWLGPVRGEEKARAINQSDIFVFPTYYPPEGHPWVVIEAMAAGLPVISTDQGAIVESVADGISGFIVDKRNPAMIATRLIELCRNPELRQAMGAASRKRYLEHFTESRMVARLAEAFRRALAP